MAGVALALSRAHGPDVLLPTYWGELHDLWSFRPVAETLRPLRGKPLWLWRIDERPSLNWYVGRRLLKADTAADLPSDPGAELWLLSLKAPEVAPYRCEAVGPALHHCRRSETGPPLSR